MLKEKLVQVFAALIVIACVSLIGTATIVKMFPFQTHTANAANSSMANVTLAPNEFPLAPTDFAVMVYCIDPAERNGFDSVNITVIVNGKEKGCGVWDATTLAERLISFELRTDGWDCTSVQFLKEHSALNDYFASAIIRVPDEDSLRRWIEWYARKVAERRSGAATYGAKKRALEPLSPARVLPPPRYDREKHDASVIAPTNDGSDGSGNGTNGQ